MPNWPAEQTPQEIEVATLKRAKQKLEDQLTDRDNEVRTLKEENGELKKQIREANYQAQHEAGQASQAQEALRKKTDAYNNLKIQKDNSETALLSSEAAIKERDGQIKKLTYELEVTSVRSATAANTKVAEEKAQLEKRVHQLSMDLQKAQLELEKEKENRSTAMSASTDSKTSLAGSKIARPPSRSSMAPNDTARSRFGFQGAATAPSTHKSRTSISSATTDSQPSSSIRPPSALSNHHSSIPGPPSKLPARRTSVSGATPSNSAINTSSSHQQAAKLAQLETSLSSAQETITYLSSDLSTAQSTISELETTLSTTEGHFSRKKEELLRVENQLMALERSSKEEIEGLKERIDEVQDELEAAREETNEVREEMRTEMELAVKDGLKEKAELEARINENVSELEYLTKELERREGEREDLSRALTEAKERVTELEETLEEKEEECVDLENELAFLEETHDEALEEAREKREDLKAEVAELKDVQGRMTRQAEDLEGLEGNREELERLLEDARQESRRLRQALSDAEAARAELQATLNSHVDKANSRELEIEDLRSRLGQTSRSSSPDSQSLEAQIAILEAEVFKKDSELDSLVNRLAQFEKLAAEHEDLVAESEANAADLEAKAEELAAVSAELEKVTSAHSTTQQLASQHETQARTLRDTVSSLAAERDDLLSKASAHSETLISLQSELDILRSAATRSHDDDDVQQLQSRLAAAEEEIGTFQVRLQEFENGEWLSSEASKDLKERVIALEEEVEQLKEALETERGATLSAELNLELVKKNLQDAQEQVTAVEGLLDIESRAREAAEQAKAELEAGGGGGGDDSFPSADLEREIDKLQAQLDDVRATAEDEAFSHLQEVTDLQLCLRDQENRIDDLQRELTVLEALRHILGETEARVDSLGWDLKAAHSSAAEQRGIAEDKLEALNRRFEAAEEECLRLRTELDETRHRLSDAQDALDQAQADLSTSTRSLPAPSTPLAASPSPTNLSFSFSPTSDPSILVTRLREERDELRSRLDFARTEADFRVKALQKRLEESEQAKVRELSIMEVDLLDKTHLLEHELDTNAKIEDDLRTAKAERSRIEEELELATKDLKVATGKVDEFERRLKEAEKAQQEHEAERESAWNLEGELEAATQSANSIRSQLETANASNAELTASLDSLRSDLREAASELDRQHATAAESSARIAELEEALSAARERDEDVQSNALADFASLCDSLESDVSGLRSKISEQTAIITARERSISLLQLNLAVRVAIDDTDDDEIAGDRSVTQEEEEAEESFAGDRTIAVEPSSSPEHLADLVGELQRAQEARLMLEANVAKLEERLAIALRNAQTSLSSTAELESQLEQARLGTVEQHKRMEETEVSFADLQRRHDSLETEREALLDTVDSLRQALSSFELKEKSRKEALQELEATVIEKQKELETATGRILELETSLGELRSLSAASTSTAQDQVASLERQLSDLDTRLSRALSDLTDANERAHLSNTSLEALQERHSSLASDHEHLKSSSAEQQAALEKVTEARAEITRLEQQLVEAEEFSILYEQAQRRISILEEQLAAAHESLAVSDGGTLGNEGELVELSNRLDAALGEVEQLSNLLERERTASEMATAAAQEAIQAEKETDSKAKAASDRAAQEIQTLRQLGRSSQAEAEALSAEVFKLRAHKDELEAHLETVIDTSRKEKQQLDAEKTAAVEEMYRYLADNEQQIKVAEASISDKLLRIEELEQVSQQQLEEIDEVNDNLIEALKSQKKLAAQAERLKAKIATLQRDLVQAKSAPSVLASTTPTFALPTAATAPEPVEAPALPLSNKKRRAPAEFDPLPPSSASAPPPPRAIVASRPVSASSLSRDKENSSTTAAKLRPTSTSTSKKVDSVVPLKPEHQTTTSQRVALRTVDENSPTNTPLVTEIKVKPSSVAASATTSRVGPGGGGGSAKLDALKAKLAAQKKRSRSGLAPTGPSASTDSN